MLAGQPPFTGPTATAILGKVVGENARPIVEHRRSVPPHVSDAIEGTREAAGGSLAERVGIR